METSRSLPYVRAIDGLRGVAVLLVLAFHGGVPGSSGGFLGVSLFFTLSGYLITQLLVREHDEHGRISLRAFWARRLRRLAPASLLALGLIGLVVVLSDAFPATSVPGDLAAAATNVANWRFAAASTAYEDLFASGPSPVLHFWSLAIEEQFYLLFPLLVVGVLHRWGRSRLAVVLVVLTVVGTIASVLSPTDLAYYGTHTRAPELLVGALLALVLPIGRPLPDRAQRALAIGGVAAAAGLGLLVLVAEVDSPWLYSGGLPAVSLLSAALIGAATVPGPLRNVVAWGPAVAVGRVSYGAYVFHWPLFLLLSQERMGFGGPALFALRIGATGAVALACGLLLEEPVRRRVWLIRGPRGAGALVAGLATVLVLAMLATPTSAPEIVPSGQALVTFGRPIEPTPVDVLVLGSVPEVVEWVRTSQPPPDTRLRVRSAVQTGCPVLLPDRREGSCPALAERAVVMADAAPPDLIVIGIGLPERVAIASTLDGVAPQSPEALAATVTALSISREILDLEVAGLPAAPLLFVDVAPGGPLTAELRALDLRSGQVTANESGTAVAVQEDVRALLGEGQDPTRLRVLVIGDSTSFQLAAALDAAGRSRVEVLWAGQTNCPLIRVERLRWAPTLDFDRSDCPSVADRWPEGVAQLRPDVVVAGASITELSDQRYAGGDRWEVPGDPGYVDAHDAGMAELQELLQATGAVTIVATTPPVLPDRKTFGGAIGEPARLAAWLAQIARWDGQWGSVGIVDWATIVTQAEAAAGHDFREDAVHVDHDALVSVLAPPLLDQVLATAAELDRTARSAGCLVGVGAARHLDLARCRTTP